MGGMDPRWNRTGQKIYPQESHALLHCDAERYSIAGEDVWPKISRQSSCAYSIASRCLDFLALLALLALLSNDSSACTFSWHRRLLGQIPTLNQPVLLGLLHNVCQQVTLSRLTRATRLSRPRS
ncbi:Phosphoenolpyruvate synthase [Fusarium oxysporum f. sp. albedinis]|nr:Phosphoenolpyruvate synthase [Fusarium oxysporum f. sp. albedinis]